MIKTIPVEVSARHIHLSSGDVELLFGYSQLKKLKPLTQPSDFAAEEKVNIVLGQRVFEGVRVVGPERDQTQVEISLTDAISAGVMPPVRLSGDLTDSLPVVLVGPKGRVKLDKGLIIAQRHIHCNEKESKKLKKCVCVKISGPREVIFKNIPIRVRSDYVLCLHLDTDEGNAAGISKFGQGEII
ncbi:phosphate propanoyltransferase [Patescibacteria group bacterium]|nr:phosphate propanoyltransferase [Patescibacteria group bacterium]